MIDLARKILLYDKLRFIITVCGVGFAVALVLVQTGLFLGLLDNASITIDHLDAEVWVAAKNTPNIDFARTFSDAYVNRVRSVEGVERADNLIVWFIRMALPNGAQEGVEMYGMERFVEWGMPWQVDEGNLQDLRRGRYVMLDDSATKRCGSFEVGDYREFIGRRMKIIGRTHGALSFTTAPVAFADMQSIQALTPELKGQTTYIVVKLKPGADRQRVIEEIRRRLPYTDVNTREDWSHNSKLYWVTSTGLGLQLACTILLGCMVAIIIVAQTLYSSTMEHLKEFGTIKAIGAGNGHIYGILARQATIAAVCGAVVGGGLTFALQPVMAKLDLKLLIVPGFWLATFVGTLVFSLAAAMISFRQVAKLDPAMVFRT
ncbi:MAG: transporter permease [Phycisphaerales bacterium]|nr:transporter permease [Phycisphaerales bacterium]